MTFENNNNFTIKDNSSDFATFLPNEWIEPLVIIARIEGYKGIDDYILELIKERLEMFTDTRDNLDDEFQQYMHNTIKGKDVPNEWASNNKEEEEESKSEKDYVNVKIDSDLVERLVNVEERKKQRQQQQEKAEESNKENASKFVKQVNEEYHDMKHTDDKEKEDLK